VSPDDIVFGGWDISSMNMADAMTRAKVLDIDLQKQLRPYMESIVPLPGIYDPDFIAANQGSRANNVIKGTKKEQMQQIIKDIRYTHRSAHQFGSSEHMIDTMALGICLWQIQYAIGCITESNLKRFTRNNVCL
jgi:hypothetical protein